MNQANVLSIAFVYGLPRSFVLNVAVNKWLAEDDARETICDGATDFVPTIGATIDLALLLKMQVLFDGTSETVTHSMCTMHSHMYAKQQHCSIAFEDSCSC